MKNLRWLFLVAFVLLLVLGLWAFQTSVQTNERPHQLSKTDYSSGAVLRDQSSINAHETKTNNNVKKGDELLNDYFNGGLGKGRAGSNTIDEIRSLQLNLPAKSVKKIGEIIKSGKIGGVELASLIRLYADQIPLSSDPEEMRSILKSVLSSTKDKDVGSAAAFSLSRVGATADVADVLKAAKANNYFTENDYYGEMAHNLPRVSSETQAAWLRELSSSQNLYGRQIVADGLAKTENISSFTKNQLIQIQEYLRSTEPEFPKNPQEFGLFTAFDYQNWVHAVNKIESSSNATERSDSISTILSKEGIDQRKVLAYMLNDENVKQFIAASTVEQRKVVVERLAVFIGKYPNDIYIDAWKQIYPKLVNGR